jgi:putative peptide zinc metalloprotease protein
MPVLSATAGSRPLELAMRHDLSVHPLRFSGRNYWGIKDPVALRYFQLRDEEYYVLRQLDGRTSLDQIKQRFERQFAPRRLDLRHLQSFLGMLHRQGLIVSLSPGQGDQLLERRTKQRRRERLGAFSNPLAIRFRGIDPEPILRWLLPLFGWFFSRWAAAGVALLALAAATLVAVQFETLQARLPEFYAFFNAQNALWLMLALALTKVLHELGHGLACKRFGGECHELGVMLLVFTPCLYCNVTDSWMLPSKWQRIAIAAAGMYVEVALASVCTFLWWFSEPGLLNSMCLNLMFVASVSTLLFNGNPLLRYDGYYILSDLIEVPNLQQQSTAVVRGALSRWVLDIEPESERLLPERRRGALAIYAVAATIYRVLVVFGILWFLYQVLKPYRLQVIAELLALFVVGGLLIAPLARLLTFLSHPGRRREVNWLRFSLFSLVAVALLCGVALVPLPYRVHAPAIVEPRDDSRVYVSVPGRLVSGVAEGAEVARGETLATLENLELEQEITVLRGELERQTVLCENLRKSRIRDPQMGALLPAAEEALADARRRLVERLEDQSRLVVTAPIGGIVMPPRQRPDESTSEELPDWIGTPLDVENRGAWFETGALIGLVGAPDRLEALAVIDQADIELVRPGQTVRLSLDETPGAVITGTIQELARIDLDVAPPELVASGALPVRNDGPAPRLASAAYQARIRLDPHAFPLRIRTAGSAKVIVDPTSLGWRVWRYLSTTFRFDL